MKKRTIFKISALFMGLILSLSPAISNQVSAQGSESPMKYRVLQMGQQKRLPP